MFRFNELCSTCFIPLHCSLEEVIDIKPQNVGKQWSDKNYQLLLCCETWGQDNEKHGELSEGISTLKLSDADELSFTRVRRKKLFFLLKLKDLTWDHTHTCRRAPCPSSHYPEGTRDLFPLSRRATDGDSGIDWADYLPLSFSVTHSHTHTHTL